MKFKIFFPILIIALLVSSCSGSIDYSEDFKNKTSGKYLYDAETLIEISYDKNTLYFDWRGAKIKPVVLSQEEFFIPDMYKKLRFATDPKTNNVFLATVYEESNDSLSYDYIKVEKNFKTPKMYLADGDYDKALQGYLDIKAKDSTSDFINEWDFNRRGYQLLRDKKIEDAIAVFKLNTQLHPNSSNVYNSLAEAYLSKGDSVLTYVNYKKAYELNPRDISAERFLTKYKPEEITNSSAIE